jgi:hypothetical protein
MVARDIFQVFATSASSLNYKASIIQFAPTLATTKCTHTVMSNGFTHSSTDEHLYYGMAWPSALNVKIPITAISSSLTKVLTTWAVVIELYYPINGIIHVFRQ